MKKSNLWFLGLPKKLKVFVAKQASTTSNWTKQIPVSSTWTKQIKAD